MLAQLFATAQAFKVFRATVSGVKTAIENDVDVDPPAVSVAVSVTVELPLELGVPLKVPPLYVIPAGRPEAV